METEQVRPVDSSLCRVPSVATDIYSGISTEATGESGSGRADQSQTM